MFANQQEEKTRLRANPQAGDLNEVASAMGKTLNGVLEAQVNGSDLTKLFRYGISAQPKTDRSCQAVFQALRSMLCDSLYSR